MIQSYRLGNALCKHSSGDPARDGENSADALHQQRKDRGEVFPVKLNDKKGYAADIIVMDYMPPTEISEKNINGHLLSDPPGGTS